MSGLLEDLSLDNSKDRHGMFSKFMNKMIFANLADFKEGKIDIMGVGAVIVSAPVLADLFLKMHKAVGKKAFDMFYEAGLNHGRLIGKVSAERFGVVRGKFFTQMTDSSNMMGLGMLEVVNADPVKGNALFRLKDSTVAQEVLKLNGKTKFPVDWFYTGTVSGIFEAVFKKKKFVAKETRCMAMGAPCCEFLVEPK
jgi:predicted hydrocarbon binding protein